MVLSIGEILVDVFVDGKRKTVFPGGAPFNVVSNIARFGGSASFYGAVGQDEYGAFLSEFASKVLPGACIVSREDRPTTIALVTLKDGERHFAFVRENGADYSLRMDELKRLDLSEVRVAHLGSLMLSEEEGRTFFHEAVSYLRKNIKGKLSFDVNYRDDIFASPEEAKRIFLEALPHFDVIKFTSEELSLLSGEEDPSKAIQKLLRKDQVAFVSLGEQGSLCFHDGVSLHVETVSLKPIDTTGAGDAFYSYILHELDQGLNLQDESALRKAMAKANFVGGYATQKKGAIGVVPTKEELDEKFPN